MDEPTSALTSREVDQLFSLIGTLVQRGVAVVYITHRLDEVYRIGQRVTVLRDGRQVATSLLSDVTVDGLVRLMANRDLTEHFPSAASSPGGVAAGRRPGPQRGAARHQLQRACRRGGRHRRLARGGTQRARARARRRRSRAHRPHHLPRCEDDVSHSRRRHSPRHRLAAGRPQGRRPGCRAHGGAKHRAAPRPQARARRISAGRLRNGAGRTRGEGSARQGHADSGSAGC